MERSIGQFLLHVPAVTRFFAAINIGIYILGYLVPADSSLSALEAPTHFCIYPALNYEAFPQESKPSSIRLWRTIPSHNSSSFHHSCFFPRRPLTHSVQHDGLLTLWLRPGAPPRLPRLLQRHHALCRSRFPLLLLHRHRGRASAVILPLRLRMLHRLLRRPLLPHHNRVDDLRLPFPKAPPPSVPSPSRLAASWASSPSLPNSTPLLYSLSSRSSYLKFLGEKVFNCPQASFLGHLCGIIAGYICFTSRPLFSHILSR